MTVALVGIGADSTNASPTPPVDASGCFEYIPIPESQGPAGTTESLTYGSAPLRHRDGTMADYLDTITPQWAGEETLRGDALAGWPLHHDPNLDALTYGETNSRGAYTKRLRTLDPGDLVAFYTGLQRDPGGPRHRYVVGYFTVDEILDCRRVDHAGGTCRFSDLPAERRRALLARHAANAHVKRYQARGSFAAPDDGLVIVDGREPGGRLDRAFRLSDRHDSGHYYLTDDLEDALAPEPGGNPDRNAYLGGIKNAHVLDIAPDSFIDLVTDGR
jgi:hypothetical protein